MARPDPNAPPVGAARPDSNAPPVGAARQEIARVLENRRVGAYHALTLVSPGIADEVRPGQFVGVAAVGTQPFLLRRPFSVHAANPGGPGVGSLELIMDVVGPGTRALAAVHTYDRLDLLGPLGRPFSEPPEGTSCLLVGGGYGSAPLFFLAQRLRALDCRVDMILGAATEARLLKVMEAKRLASSLRVTTDDGSAGVRGMVTDVIPQVMEHARTRRVYACGPMAMLAAVSRLAAAAGVDCEVAVEEHMACGTGICFSCVVPLHTDTPDGSGAAATRMTRTCTDGPVLDGSRVAWHELGYPAATDQRPPGPATLTAQELVS